MSWIEMQWVLPREHSAKVSQLLFSLNCLGIQEDYLPGQEPPPPQPWDKQQTVVEPPDLLLRAWWPEQTSELTVAIEMIATQLGGATPQWVIQGKEDWGEDWKQHFHRRIINDKLVVSPSWEAKEGDLIVDPGSAFGTGDHPTTHACLQAIAQWSKPGEACLDVGCGSGILALAAAKLGMSATGIDIEDGAIVEARANSVLNGLTAEFSTTPIQNLQGCFPLVVANLYAEVLANLSSDIMRLSSHRIALAGILFDRSHMVRDAFSAFNCIREKREGDWVHLWYEHP
jgi:ribosomal protein L11 methyltransferase